MISEIKTIQGKTLPLNLDKIRKHEIELGDLEVKLNKIRWNFQANVYIEGYDRKATIKTWGNEQQAKEEFQKILKSFEEGNYHINLYSNGKIGVNVEY
jgi:transketolase